MQRSKKRKRKTLLGEKKEKERSVLKNSLTTPALLEMSGKAVIVQVEYLGKRFEFVNAFAIPVAPL
jgi:hypothetical protein